MQLVLSQLRTTYHLVKVAGGNFLQPLLPALLAALKFYMVAGLPGRPDIVVPLPSAASGWVKLYNNVLHYEYFSQFQMSQSQERRDALVRWQSHSLSATSSDHSTHWPQSLCQHPPPPTVKCLTVSHRTPPSPRPFPASCVTRL